MAVDVVLAPAGTDELLGLLAVAIVLRSKDAFGFAALWRKHSFWLQSKALDMGVTSCSATCTPNSSPIGFWRWLMQKEARSEID